MSKNINETIFEKIFTLGKMMRQHMLQDDASQLTFLQMEALSALKIAGSMSMRHIAQQFQIAMPTATVLIDRLKELKLVSRKSDMEDRRIVHISLTKKGETLLNKGMEKRKAHIKKILTSISDGEKEQMVIVLEKMIGKAQKIYEKK